MEHLLGLSMNTRRLEEQKDEFLRGLLDERVDGPPNVRREEDEYHSDVAQYHQRRGNRADHHRCTAISPNQESKHTENSGR